MRKFYRTPISAKMTKEPESPGLLDRLSTSHSACAEIPRQTVGKEGCGDWGGSRGVTLGGGEIMVRPVVWDLVNHKT